jgi:hypothetical protein
MADEKAKTERDEALRKAYAKATKRLREAHQPEFNALYAEEAKVLGYDWSPKPTKEEKARDELNRLLAEFPHLAAQIGPEEPQEPAVPAQRGPSEA